MHGARINSSKCIKLLAHPLVPMHLRERLPFQELGTLPHRPLERPSGPRSWLRSFRFVVRPDEACVLIPASAAAPVCKIAAH
jgi:hypothetical protein